MLPPILYQAALLTSWHDFKANIRPIGLLAIGLVIATTLAVGAALKLLIPDMPWAAAFALGAIVSPPDAVAATAILSRLKIPRRVVTVLEGESLVNDASGLVLYKFAVAATLTGTFSLAQAGAQFALVSFGGVACGIALGFVFIAVHQRLGDRLHRGADHARRTLRRLHPGRVRPPLRRARGGGGRPVARALFAGNRLGRDAHPGALDVEHPGVPAEQPDFHPHRHAALGHRRAARRLQRGSARHVRGAGERGGDRGALRLDLSGDLAAAPGERALSRKRNPAPPEAELFIMSWCGMRGIVSLAAALALPLVLENGAPFPAARPDHLPHLRGDRRDPGGAGAVARPAHPPAARRQRLEPRGGTARGARGDGHGRDRGHRRRGEGGGASPKRSAARISAEFAEKITHAGSRRGADHQRSWTSPTACAHAAIKAERAALIRIWREHQISDEVLHQFEEILDYQEAHS